MISVPQENTRHSQNRRVLWPVQAGALCCPAPLCLSLSWGIRSLCSQHLHQPAFGGFPPQLGEASVWVFWQLRASRDQSNQQGTHKTPDPCGGELRAALPIFSHWQFFINTTSLKALPHFLFFNSQKIRAKPHIIIQRFAQNLPFVFKPRPKWEICPA